MRLFIYHLLLLASYFITAHARYFIQCSNPASAAAIQNAIAEASQVAASALLRLQTMHDEVVVAAFKPLFIDSDLPTLQNLYTRVTNIATDPLLVTFFCDENHIQWSDVRNGWMDTAYTYTASDGQVKSVTQYRIAAGDAKTKPGARGSHSSLGYRIQLLSDTADCSDQGHVYVWDMRVNPPPNDGYDHRSLNEIVSQGINPQFAALDRIKPLSETILHELMHIYGGLQSPTGGKKNILDTWNGIRVRDFQACVSANVNRNVNGFTPLQAADPPTILAKALYLQPHNQPPMFWSLGAVDVQTGAPVGIPPPPGPQGKRWLSWVG